MADHDTRRLVDAGWNELTRGIGARTGASARISEHWRRARGRCACWGCAPARPHFRAAARSVISTLRGKRHFWIAPTGQDSRATPAAGRRANGPPSPPARARSRGGRNRAASGERLDGGSAPAADIPPRPSPDSDWRPMQPTRGARPQGAPPTAQPSRHANRSRRAETPRAGAEAQRCRANRYG